MYSEMWIQCIQNYGYDVFRNENTMYLDVRIRNTMCNIPVLETEGMSGLMLYSLAMYSTYLATGALILRLE